MPEEIKDVEGNVIATTENETKLSATLSEEEMSIYQASADKLAQELNVSKVHVCVQIDPITLKRAVAFLKEPNYQTKIRVMDKVTTIGLYSAADELREACILTKESDPITWGDWADCDSYKLGIVDYCLTMIKRLQNQFKKK